VGRGSNQSDDVRFTRPYDAYLHLGHQLIEARSEGDALSRQWVRVEEINGSFHFIRQATDRLERTSRTGDLWRSELGILNGEDWGWAEAPQGELLYLVKVEDGTLARVKPRSASFHNLGLFQAAFPRDVLTDFAFIEASFGLSIAGVAG
jgi:Ni,Fe-hydrogenase III large subunit